MSEYQSCHTQNVPNHDCTCLVYTVTEKSEKYNREEKQYLLSILPWGQLKLNKKPIVHISHLRNIFELETYRTKLWFSTLVYLHLIKFEWNWTSGLHKNVNHRCNCHYVAALSLQIKMWPVIWTNWNTVYQQMICVICVKSFFLIAAKHFYFVAIIT